MSHLSWFIIATVCCGASIALYADKPTHFGAFCIGINALAAFVRLPEMLKELKDESK